MSKYIPGNQKHLTLNDRIYIENELAKGTTFKDIAAFLCKDPTTISKEVRAHRLSDWYHKHNTTQSEKMPYLRYWTNLSSIIYIGFSPKNLNLQFYRKLFSITPGKQS